MAVASNREPDKYYIDSKALDHNRVLAMVRGVVEQICTSAANRISAMQINV